ncbi:hypothetical protein [Hymenobacter sp. IS2118]|uniref:hypothetical protein n=1 Tax=Hymenobacter sp. IS2118 TaxID=1505605 RepID=UPI0006892312|nr:hypothetical protein [Hymenobacter sp. IS2118]
MASSCQSSRSSFSFQTPPRHLPAVLMASPAAAEASTEAAPLATPPPRVAARLLNKMPRAVPPRPAKQPFVASEAAVVLTSAPAAVHRRQWLHRPQATAEAGLGTTVLGVLGLIALPVAILGLVLSGGGLVWAIVAGLAAVAVLVAYLDPFGR